MKINQLQFGYSTINNNNNLNYYLNTNTNNQQSTKMVSKSFIICALLITIALIMEVQAGDKGSNIILGGGPGGGRLVLSTGKKGKGSNIISQGGFGGGDVILSTGKKGKGSNIILTRRATVISGRR